MKGIKSIILGAGMAIATMLSCSTGGNTQLTESGLNPAAFDTTINNKPVKLFTLKNKSGMEVCITNFGGRVVSLTVPDKDGKPTDVVLGYDNIRQYADSVNSPSDYGSTVGRYANRIDKGHLHVNGKDYQLPQNNFGHCLHGGPSGWMYQVYDAEQPNDTTLVMRLMSPDGDNNFPGTVKTTATYKVLSNNTLDITFEATTDKETVVNMTNHSYFNLNGDPSKEGTNMVLYVNADNFTPADDTYMTTGEIKPVEGTPMDFRKPHAISETINDTTYQQIKNATGYDHNWCLNTKGDKSKAAVKLYDPRSGIVLQVYTNEPGIQVYTGNFQDGSCTGKKGIVYNKQCAVCLETQKYPDSPNKYQMEGWEDSNCWLNPGETYESYCKFAFSVQK